MRGEHGSHVEPSDGIEHLVHGMASLAEPPHRPPRRRRLRLRTRAAQVLVASTHPMYLLGGVDEEEEQREGARGDDAQLEWKRRDVVEQFVDGRGARIAVAACSARPAKLLDGIERLVPLEPADDAAESRGEAPDVVVEGEVFLAGAGLGEHQRLRSARVPAAGGWVGLTPSGAFVVDY